MVVLFPYSVGRYIRAEMSPQRVKSFTTNSQTSAWGSGGSEGSHLKPQSSGENQKQKYISVAVHMIVDLLVTQLTTTENVSASNPRQYQIKNIELLLYYFARSVQCLDGF